MGLREYIFRDIQDVIGSMKLRISSQAMLFPVSRLVRAVDPCVWSCSRIFIPDNTQNLQDGQSKKHQRQIHVNKVCKQEHPAIKVKRMLYLLRNLCTLHLKIVVFLIPVGWFFWLKLLPSVPLVRGVITINSIHIKQYRHFVLRILQSFV